MVRFPPLPPLVRRAREPGVILGVAALMTALATVWGLDQQRAGSTSTETFSQTSSETFPQTSSERFPGAQTDVFSADPRSAAPAGPHLIEGPTQPVGPGFRAFVADIDPADPILAAGVEATTDGELTVVATELCTGIGRGLDQAAFTDQALAYHRDPANPLTDLDGASFVRAAGALVGLACPERLPVTTPPPVEPARADPLPSQARAVMAELWPSDDPVRRFLADLDDGRLTELAREACRLTDGVDSTTAFGFAARQHRRSAVSAEERVGLSSSGHAEVFGFLVGWWCPELLPTISR